MAPLVLAVAGAGLGYMMTGTAVVALGMTGAQIGWAVGGAIGSMMSQKTQKAEGPRLGDLTVGGSSYGSIIPYIEGHPRISGQIIWSSIKREIATTEESGGKGGGGSEITTYAYEVDLLILLADCVCSDILRVWSGGDLIYTQAESADGASLEASADAVQWARMTFYNGADDQLPDPDYELAVEHAPAYRGRSSVFIKSLKLGQGGQIPNLTFEIARTTGDRNYAETFYTESVSRDNIKPTGDWAGIVDENVNFNNKRFGVSSLKGASPDVSGVYSAAMQARWDRQRAGAAQGHWVYELWVFVTSYGTGKRIFSMTPVFNGGGSNYQGHHGLAFDSTGHLYPGIHDVIDYVRQTGVPGVSEDALTPLLDGPGGAGETYDYWMSDSTDVTVNPYPIPLNRWVPIVMQCTLGGIIDTFVDGRSHRHAWKMKYNRSWYGGVATTTYPEGYRPQHPLPFNLMDQLHNDQASSYPVGITGAFNQPSYDLGKISMNGSDSLLIDSFRLSSNSLYQGEYVVPISSWSVGSDTVTLYKFNEFHNVEAFDPTIAEVVSRLCTNLAGLDETQFSVAAIESISTRVHGMVISQPTSVRTTLDLLMGCYFFDCVLSDKLYFRPRAGASVATVPFDDIGWVVDGTDVGELLPMMTADELELPSAIALTYSNIDGDYQTDTQYSDRIVSTMQSTSVFQIPLGFTAAEAKVIADARMLDMFVSLTTSKVELDLAYSRLEPTDVIIVTGRDGSTYRQRLLKKQDADCVLMFDTVLDDATVFTQLGLTAGGTDSQTTVNPVPATIMLLLDMPILRDTENTPGLYIPVKGLPTLGWHVADLFHSTNNVTYTLDASYSSEATFGSTTTALSPCTAGFVFDETSSVIVNVGEGTLSSVTRAALLTNKGLNLALIGHEVVQFRTAALLDTGIYKLTSFLRGCRGTDWAWSSHLTNERFVLLTTRGFRFVPLSTSELGLVRYYKAVTAGQRLSDVEPSNVTPFAINMKPFSPVNLRVDRSTEDIVLMCTRRTRLDNRVGGPMPQNIPLGETTEAYEWDIYDNSSFNTVLRTLTSTVPEVTYTAAQQAADFGSPLPGALSWDVRQMSSVVGRGYARRITS